MGMTVMEEIGECLFMADDCHPDRVHITAILLGYIDD